MPLNENELIERDAKRNIGEELLASIRDVKAGRHATVWHVATTAKITDDEHGRSLPLLKVSPEK